MSDTLSSCTILLSLYEPFRLLPCCCGTSDPGSVDTVALRDGPGGGEGYSGHTLYGLVHVWSERHVSTAMQAVLAVLNAPKDLYH